MDTGSEDEIPVASTDEKTKFESQPGSEEEKESEGTDGRDEHVAEAAEDAYLSEWTKQWNANIKENSKRKQSEVSCCWRFITFSFVCIWLLAAVVVQRGKP
jgi:hypothetical protein